MSADRQPRAQPDYTLNCEEPVRAALVIANKAALTVTAAAYAIHGGVDEATTIAGWDGSITIMLVVAYLLCRGRRD